MEIYGNTMENITTNLSIDECHNRLNHYAKSGIDITSSLETNNGVKIRNVIFEKYSFRNGNFLTVYMNLVQEEGVTYGFFTVKERQEGLINFSLGKKKKIISEIKELLEA